MCARFGLFRWGAELSQTTGFPEGYAARWNISPQSQVLMVLADEQGLRVQPARWGLTPAWLTDFSRTPAHARAETVAQQPMFAEAFRLRRALVPANGFYEWRGGQRRRPYWMTADDGRLLSMAAIWELYPIEGGCFYSLALLTYDEAGQRRPVLLDQAGQRAWLEAQASVESLQALLEQRAVPLRQRLLAPFVNDPALDAPECLTPA